MNSDESRAQPHEIENVITQGLNLKEQALAIVNSRFDKRTIEYPGAIYEGEFYSLGELELPIERWFNEAEVLIRDSLSYRKRELEYALNGILRLSVRTDRNSAIQRVSNGFNLAIRRLQALPNVPKPISASEFGGFAFRQNTAFILMWMSRERPELEDVSNSFKEVFEEFDIHARRADDIEHQDVITDLILQHIRESEFLVADLSGERPNVYYEIGYAHAIGKRPILYRRTGTPLHFDLSVHNVPEYSNVTELKRLLRKRLEAITGKQPKLER